MKSEGEVTDAEKRLLATLTHMCDQYMSDGRGLDHLSMGAGESALHLLAEYGL